MRCVIIDNDVLGPAFGPEAPLAGITLLKWILKEEGRLVVGGKLAEELEVRSRLKRGAQGSEAAHEKKLNEWLVQVWRGGRLLNVDLDRELKTEVLLETARLKEGRPKKENDKHVIALAKVSGARLLYSNDKVLHKEFTTRSLLDNPRGKVYSTLKTRRTTPNHRRLLREAHQCGGSIAL